jgi:hypothetical protein
MQQSPMGSFVEGDLHLVMDANVSKPTDFHLFLYFLSYFGFLSSCYKERVDGHWPGLDTN